MDFITSPKQIVTTPARISPQFIRDSQMTAQAQFESNGNNLSKTQPVTLRSSMNIECQHNEARGVQDLKMAGQKGHQKNMCSMLNFQPQPFYKRQAAGHKKDPEDPAEMRQLFANMCKSRTFSQADEGSRTQFIKQGLQKKVINLKHFSHSAFIQLIQYLYRIITTTKLPRISGTSPPGSVLASSSTPSNRTPLGKRPPTFTRQSKMRMRRSFRTSLRTCSKIKTSPWTDIRPGNQKDSS